MGFFDSHFFPFLGPTADKTRFANLEELKMEHKIRHHSSVVGFCALSWLQLKNFVLGFMMLVWGSFLDPLWKLTLV